MNWNDFNIHEWEKEKCEELVRLESERIERERREKLEEECVTLKEECVTLKEECGTLKEECGNTIKNMIKKNFSLEDICDITGKSMKEIKQIKKELNDI